MFPPIRVRLRSVPLEMHRLAALGDGGVQLRNTAGLLPLF
jgi:hypothetical protein